MDKRILLLLLVISLAASTPCQSQTLLYSQNGIQLSFINATLQSFPCTEYGATVFFVTARWTLSNFSGRPAYIQMSANMYANGPADGCMDDDILAFKYSPGGCSVDGILPAGNSITGEDGNWFLTQTVVPWYWVKTVRFGTDPNAAATPTQTTQKPGTPPPVFTQTTKTVPGNTVVNIPGSLNKASPNTITQVYQNDVIINPKPPVNYIAMGQAQNSATAQAMQAWANAYQQSMDQITSINKGFQDEQNQERQQVQQAVAQANQLNAQRKAAMIQQQQATVNARIQSQQQAFTRQQSQSQQAQASLLNAQNTAMAAFDQAIGNGKSGSGAMLDATIAGAGQISDQKAALAYTGVGLGVSLFMALSEAADARHAAAAEEEKKRLTIATKNKYIKEALDLNHYSVGDLAAKERSATLLIVPDTLTAVDQVTYFTYPIKVPAYSDGSFPLPDKVRNNLLSSIDKKYTRSSTVYLLYPITDESNFGDEFIKKMGSGKVIKLTANLVNFDGSPFEPAIGQSAQKDFWGNSIKEAKKPVLDSTQKKTKSFWDQ